MTLFEWRKEAKPAKAKRKAEACQASAWAIEILKDSGYEREKTTEVSALSPQKTQRIHVLQHNTPEGGRVLSTYPTDATPFEEAKEERGRRLATNRERRWQAFNVLEAITRARHQDVGLKFDRRAEIAALPPKKGKWLAAMLRREPGLLDFNPALFPNLRCHNE